MSTGRREFARIDGFRARDPALAENTPSVRKSKEPAFFCPRRRRGQPFDIPRSTHPEDRTCLIIRPAQPSTCVPIGVAWVRKRLCRLTTQTMRALDFLPDRVAGEDRVSSFRCLVDNTPSDENPKETVSSTRRRWPVQFGRPGGSGRLAAELRSGSSFGHTRPFHASEACRGIRAADAEPRHVGSGRASETCPSP